MFRREKYTWLLRIGALLIAVIMLLGIILDSVGVI